MKQIHRGQIYYADLTPVQGSEQGGLRPVLIIQNDMGNRYSPTTIVAPLTSQLRKRFYPTNVDLEPIDTGLSRSSRVCCEQVRTIDKTRLHDCVGAVCEEKMKQVEKAIMISLGVEI